MKHHMKIIECTLRDDFAEKVASFYDMYIVVECKFQRNLYYAGVGSSDGYDGDKEKTEKVAQGKVVLTESFVAFIVYKDKPNLACADGSAACPY